MSRADELKAKAEQLRQKKEAAEQRNRPPVLTDQAPPVVIAEQAPVTAADKERHLAPVAAPHVKPIRSTIDLPPMRHASLKSWCGETAVQIGRSRVTTQDVMRTLVDRLLTDETLARKIREDLRSNVQ